MTRIKISFIPFLLIVSCGREKSSVTNCSLEKLEGDWHLINHYRCKINSIDTLTKDPNTYWSYGRPKLTFSDKGTFVNDQGDYQITGSFVFDEKTCKIKKFNESFKKSDTFVLELTYIDSDYLILSDTGHGCFSNFYGRK